MVVCNLSKADFTKFVSLVHSCRLVESWLIFFALNFRCFGLWQAGHITVKSIRRYTTHAMDTWSKDEGPPYLERMDGQPPPVAATVEAPVTYELFRQPQLSFAQLRQVAKDDASDKISNLSYRQAALELAEQKLRRKQIEQIY